MAPHQFNLLFFFLKTANLAYVSYTSFPQSCSIKLKFPLYFKSPNKHLPQMVTLIQLKKKKMILQHCNSSSKSQELPYLRSSVLMLSCLLFKSFAVFAKHPWFLVLTKAQQQNKHFQFQRSCKGYRIRK